MCIDVCPYYAETWVFMINSGKNIVFIKSVALVRFTVVCIGIGLNRHINTNWNHGRRSWGG